MRKYIYEVVKNVGLDNQWVGLIITIGGLAFFSMLMGTLSGWVWEAL